MIMKILKFVRIKIKFQQKIVFPVFFCNEIYKKIILFSITSLNNITQFLIWLPQRIIGWKLSFFILRMKTAIILYNKGRKTMISVLYEIDGK